MIRIAFDFNNKSELTLHQNVVGLFLVYDIVVAYSILQFACVL